MSEQPAKRIGSFGELDNSSICYWKAGEYWMLYLPGVGVGNLRGHSVQEHEDGTITVTPSILVDAHPQGQRHGFLTRGVWRDC